MKKLTKLTIVATCLLSLTGCALFGTGSEESSPQSADDPLVMRGELEEKNQSSTSYESTDTRRTSREPSPTLRTQEAPDRTEQQQSDQQMDQQADQPAQIQPDLSAPTMKSAEQLASEGREAYDNREYSKAIDRYQKAIERGPTRPEYHFNLGSIYYVQENFQEARNQYQEAIRLKNDHEMAHLYLGATYLQLGNRSSARQHFNWVLEINPNNEKAQQYLNQL
jgi:Flp pilus assembly protein TadD